MKTTVQPLGDFAAPQAKNAASRSLWIDYLRSFITVLVVAHHAALAYTTFAYYNKDVYILSTHPIADTKRWIGLDIFENFNDVFFMSLMFLISGIFIIKGLQKKGAGAFIRDRVYRLFIPFLIGVTLLMLIAYYPSWLVGHPNTTIKAYVIDFFTTEGWPVGPPWFIWVLFFFNVVFAILYKPFAGMLAKAGIYVSGLKSKPFAAFAWLLCLTLVLYLPAVWIFGAESWAGYGPFDFQKSRMLLYFGYFVTGSLIGSTNLDTGLFDKGSAFAAKWPLWVAGCIFFYALLTLSPAHLSSAVAQKQITDWTANTIYRTIYVFSATFSCIAFLTVFRRFVTHATRVWDSLASNAYCIYLIHYIFVVWCQYELMSIDLPAIAKFAITLVVAIGLSWFVSSLLRKIPLIKTWI